MSNLAVLLAERKLRISRAATDTGVSRTTLTALSQNDFKGVQVDTMNTLCQYLSVTPGELFDFVPFDLTFSIAQESLMVSGIERGGDYVEEVIIQKADIDAFLKRSAINEAVGRSEKTFDLTIRITKDVPIPSKNKNPFDDDSNDSSPTEIPIEVLLGHSDDNKAFESQNHEFQQMWDNDLTPAFRAQVSNLMDLTIKKTISGMIREYFAAHIKNDLFEPDWNKLRYSFSVSFKNAYTEEKNGPLSIKFNMKDLPF
jgi:DNA-binding Xre family transcriptional regulator